jgi:hypothetical protein
MSKGKHTNAVAELFITFLLMVIALALTPTVSSSVISVTLPGGGTMTNSNLTGPALALAQLIPLFWVIIIIGIGVAAVYVQLKNW